MAQIERPAEEVSAPYADLIQTRFRGGDALRSSEPEPVDALVAPIESQNVARDWLEPLSEIHLGATEALDDEHALVSFARFTAAAGEQISLPVGVADKYSRGRRIYPSNPGRSPGIRRQKPAAGAATTS